MNLFEQSTQTLLAKHLVNESIGAVSLAAYGLSMQIGDISITCNERVFARIEGAVHEWTEGPNRAPWGWLVRQKVVGVDLTRPDLLRISLESGDYLEIETVEGPYESVLIDFPRRGETVVMEIY